MPNWCENYIIVSGPQEQLQRLVETKCDFNEIIPEPNWDDGCHKLPDWRRENWGCKWNRCEENFGISYDEQPTSYHRPDKTGWKSSTDKVPASFDKVTFYLETPSSPALPICEELEKRGLTISAYFFEPGIRLLGLRSHRVTRFFYVDGVVTFHNEGTHYEPHNSLKECLSKNPLHEMFERLFSECIFFEEADFVEDAPTLSSRTTLSTSSDAVVRKLNTTA